MKRLLISSTLLLAACGQSAATSAGDLSRLQLKSEAVNVDTTGVDTSSISSMSVGAGSVHANDLICSLLCLLPSMTLIGTVAPPTVNSLSLQASDVTINGTKAYVAYNTAGAAQAGGIDVIDFSNSGTPVLSSSTQYADTDINKVFVDATNSKLYMAGNTSGSATGAILKRVGLDSGGLLTSAVESKVLRSAADATVPAYAGTSVLKSGNYIYAVSGNNGGLSVLNASDLSDAAFTAIPDARDIAAGPSSNVLVVTGQTVSTTAGVQSYALTTGALQSASASATSFAGSAIDAAKSSIFVGSDAYVASGGQGGTKLICFNGTSIGSMPSPSIAGLSSAETAANAVTYGNGIVYVAQGGAGVYMYGLQSPLLNLAGCSGYTLSYLGKFSLASRASANNVYYSNGYLVVSTGYGGFQIIQVTQSLVAGLLSLL